MTTGERILALAHKKLEAGDAAGFWHCLSLHRLWVAACSDAGPVVDGRRRDDMPGKYVKSNRKNPQENQHV